MKSLFKNIIYQFLSISNFKEAVILMYHSIGENEEFFTVRPAEFERQMKYLKENNFNVISLKNFIEILEKKEKISPKTILITFDDGYENNFQNAFPILKKYNFPATIFISTNLIGKETIARKGAKLKILSVQQIQEMEKSSLIEFGSHSHNHVRLTKLNDFKIEDELKISKDVLGKIIGKEMGSLAYPYGDFDERVKSVVKKYFKIACTIEKGRVKANDDLLLLKRNSIDSRVNFWQFKGIVKFGRI